MIEMNKIHNVDCLEFMRNIPDNYFDLVLTDPPYGLGIDGQKHSIAKSNKHNRKQHIYKGWDSKTPPQEIFNQIFRVSKNQIIFGANYFMDKININSKGWIIWDKGQRELTMSDCEIAFGSLNCKTKIYTYNRCELMLEGTVHPTQKPVKLFKAILHDYSKKGFKIFDPFMGSGTTAIACKSLGLEWCGCELESSYVEKANERLTKVQGDMFGLEL